MGALHIRRDYTPSDLRRLAAREKDRRAAMRLLAIANALEGMARAEAAWLAGMERQALRDAVLRFNAEGPAGLHDRHRSGRPDRLSAGQQAALKAHVLRGPDPDRDGVSAWRLVDLCAHVARAYGVRYSLWGLSRLLRRLNLSRQKTRPSHPTAIRPRGRRLKKRLRPSLRALAGAHPDKRIELWCQDEARIGQKGRTTRVWYERGLRPPGVVERGYKNLYLFAACRPGTDEAFALALPRADAGTMAIFLAHFSRQLAPDAHAVLILDGAGWHDTRALPAFQNITLMALPATSPELNPVERIWLYLRERFLSHRLFGDSTGTLDATCRAWNRLLDEKGRLASLTAYPYLVGSEIP